MLFWKPHVSYKIKRKGSRFNTRKRRGEIYNKEAIIGLYRYIMIKVKFLENPYKYPKTVAVGTDCSFSVVVKR